MVFGCLLILVVLTFVRPQDFVPGFLGLPLVNITMILLLVSWLFKKVVSQDQKSMFSPAHWLMVLLWGVIVLSTLAIHWLSATFTIFFDWAKVVVIFFMAGEVLCSISRIRTFVWCVVLSVGFTALAGILQYYGHDITGAGIIIEQGIPRIRGISIFDTNQLAYTVAFCLPLVFGLMFASSNTVARIFLIILSVVYLYCVYLTQSRGGQLCAAFILPLSFLFVAKGKFVKSVALILSAAIFIFAYSHSSRLSTTDEYKTDKSSMGRVEMWASALSGVKQYPLFGFGKDQFTENYERASHNSYIQAVAELGLVGLYLWLALFYISLKDLKLVAKGNRRDQLDIFAKALQVSLYSYLFGSLFSSSAYYITLYILLALTVAICRTAFEQRIISTRAIFSAKDAAVIAICEVVVLFAIHILSKISYS